MVRILFRIGGLLIVAAAVYTAVWEIAFGGAEGRVTRTMLEAGAICLGGGGLAWIAGRAFARIAGASCPRCGRRVARGRIYCDDHRAETINAYRDRERTRGE